MTPLIDFTGVEAFEPPKRKSLTGSWLKKRTEFFANYFPLKAARRMAARYTITPGSKWYSVGIMDGLRALDEWITIQMKLRPRISRKEAVSLVWENLIEAYRARGKIMETSNDVLHQWIGDNS